MNFTVLWILLTLLIIISQLKKSISEPRATEALTICSNRTAPDPDRQIHVANFLAAMDSITSQVYRQKYGAAVNGTGNDTVYAFAECMKDLSQNDCNLCLARVKIQTTKCRPIQRLTKGGRLFYDGCFLRFDDYDFFNESLSDLDRVVCGGDDFVGDKGLFGDIVLDLARNMSFWGPKNDGFFTGFVSSGNLTVYGLAQCWEIVNGSGCVGCLGNSVSRIGSCVPKVEGRVLNAGCYVRYSLTRFYNNSGSDAPSGNGGSVSNGNLTVYGLAQCWEIVNGSDCVGCLGNSVSRIGFCVPKVEGRVLNAGCYLRYSLTRFYNNSGSDAPSGNGGGSHRSAIVASTFGTAAFLVVVAMISFFARKKIIRQRRAKKKLGALLSIVNKSKINFSYETLERATDYFHISNKLGQGGSGSVYKGILPGGQIVAVKRLLFNTTQWADHFFNEVNLISGIDHKNLVKLLGCSITGPESLLVYEYVANQSLHDHLFPRKDVPTLGWEERYKIILGIAEGLAYLHEESKLRIIHRDIKLTNVLLDEDFTPKVADFGLARLFPEDKTHVSTAIAGTLGYMAPEYIVRGKLTEKADVYSFGILVIEVVTGTKNNAFDQNSYSILQKVWNLYGTGKLSEAVDSSIKGKFSEDEANRLLQIGLTCVQADAELRPSMSVVVKMITGEHEIFSPKQPPFLNSSSSEFSQHSPVFYQPDICTGSSGNEITESFTEPR